MAGLSYLKRARVLDSSLYIGISRNFVVDLERALRISGISSARDFSSIKDVKNRDGLNTDELKFDSVRRLLEEYGFTSEQITKVSKFAQVLSGTVDNLSPKLEFLQSILGNSNDVTRVVTMNPRLLSYSLKNQLIPNYEYIKYIVKKEDLAAKVIKRSARILMFNVENNLAANVSLLRDSGLPCSSIAKLMEYSPFVFTMSNLKLKESLKKVKSFGFEPSSPMIVAAIRAVNQISKSTWDQKVEVFRKWGWSSDDFTRAFKRQPLMMCVSEKKINKAMDVFVNRNGLSSVDICRTPYVLSLSVEDKIIPRCSIIKLLVSSGVLNKPPTYSVYYSALTLTEEAFVKKFVNKYPEHVLELWLKLRQKTVV